MALLAPLVLALALGTDPDLAAAERAFNAGRYEDVLPALDRALGKPLPPAERRRAHELQAITHAAFEEPSKAIAAFQEVLADEPTWEPPRMTSPKVRALFESAKKRGPAIRVAPPPPPEKAPERVAEKPPEKLPEKPPEKPPERVASTRAPLEPGEKPPERLAARPPPAVVAPVENPPPEEEKPLYKQWWLWTGVAVLAAGASVGVWAGTRTSVPQGSLGSGTLP